MESTCATTLLIPISRKHCQAFNLEKNPIFLLLYTCIAIHYWLRVTTELGNFSSNLRSIKAFLISMSSFSASSFSFSINNFSSSSLIFLFPNLMFSSSSSWITSQICFFFWFLESGWSDDAVDEEAKFDVEGRKLGSVVFSNSVSVKFT